MCVYVCVHASVEDVEKIVLRTTVMFSQSRFLCFLYMEVEDVLSLEWSQVSLRTWSVKSEPAYS